MNPDQPADVDGSTNGLNWRFKTLIFQSLDILGDAGLNHAPTNSHQPPDKKSKRLLRNLLCILYHPIHPSKGIARW